MKGNQCGSCKWFLKLKQMKFSSGLCTFWDGRIDQDSQRCSKFKRIKFHRIR